MENHGECKWPDLLKWLEICHRAVIDIPQACLWSHARRVENIINLAFEMTVKLRPLPWHAAREVLDLYAKSVAGAQSTIDRVIDIGRISAAF